MTTPEVTYHDMAVGRRFTPHSFSLDQAQLDAYREVVKVADPQGLGLLAAHARAAYNTEGPTPSGGVMAEMSFAMREPLAPGVDYVFTAEVVEQYVRKDKGWVRLRAGLVGAGRPVGEVSIVGVWPL